MKSTIPLRGDTVYDGLASYYYPDGHLESEVTYSNGLLEGLEKGYYPSERIRYKGTNRAGQKDSIWSYYYATGAVEHLEGWSKGKMIGDYKAYSEFGKLINYRFYNLGKLMYKAEFLDNGQLASQTGIPMALVYNRNVFKVGDTCEMGVLIGAPDSFSISLTVKQLKPRYSILFAYSGATSGIPRNKYGNVGRIASVVNELGLHEFVIALTAERSFYSDTLTVDVHK